MDREREEGESVYKAGQGKVNHPEVRQKEGSSDKWEVPTGSSSLIGT